MGHEGKVKGEKGRPDMLTSPTYIPLHCDILSECVAKCFNRLRCVSVGILQYTSIIFFFLFILGENVPAPKFTFLAVLVKVL